MSGRGSGDRRPAEALAEYPSESASEPAWHSGAGGARATPAPLYWPDCRNARDLGGLVGEGGRRIRAGALVRSDDHSRLTEDAVRTVRASGVVRIVDLRWVWECERQPSPFAGDAVYRHVPMLADELTYDPPADSYAPMLDHNRERIGAAFRAVAEAPPGGVAVHCRSGRDRTGVLVGLLLAVAGVCAAEIEADYARTEGCTPVPMRNTLAHAGRRYGGVDRYLVVSGVEPRLLDAARSRLLE